MHCVSKIISTVYLHIVNVLLKSSSVRSVYVLHKSSSRNYSLAVSLYTRTHDDFSKNLLYHLKPLRNLSVDYLKLICHPF